MRSHVTTWFGTLVLLVNTNIIGAVILLDNTRNPSTGDNLDGIADPTAGIVLPEIPGLEITVNSVGDTEAPELKSTTTSLGINSEGTDAAD
jgi:hypothetical protein